MYAIESSAVLRGGASIVSAMALIGLIDNLIRVIAVDAGLWQFIAFRSAMACPLIILFCLMTGRRMRVHRFWPVLLRSCLISSAIIIYFGSLTLLPIASAGASLFTSPIFMLVISVTILRTRVGAVRVAAIAVGFVGMLLVLKPNPADFGPMMILPLMAGLLYAIGQLVTRRLCSKEDTIMILFGFFSAIGILGLIGLAILALAPIPDEVRSQAPFFLTGWSTPTRPFLFWTAVQAVGSLIAVAGLIRGYQIAEPTIVGVFEYSFLLFAGFWSWVFWSELPDQLGLLGIALIASAGTAIALRAR